jgi:hypothetical protein
MVETMEIAREAFLEICKLHDVAMKDRPGSRKALLEFEPKILRLTTDWGSGYVDTTGAITASVKIPFKNIKRIIRTQGLNRMKNDTFTLTIATKQGKLIVGNASEDVKSLKI